MLPAGLPILNFEPRGECEYAWAVDGAVLTYREAERQCRDQGGTLPMLDDSSKLRNVMQYLTLGEIYTDIYIYTGKKGSFEAYSMTKSKTKVLKRNSLF